MCAATQRAIGFRPREISTRINETVIAVHAEDAAFLWLLRDQAVDAPHYSLQDLADLDERVEAHLDGLRVAGEYGWELAQQELTSNEPGECFVAGVLAFGSADPERIEVVIAAVAEDPALQRGVISSLGWLPFEVVQQSLEDLLGGASAVHRRIGIAGHLAHRRDPGVALLSALEDRDVALRVRALEAVGELGRVDLMPRLRAALGDVEEACVEAAAWSAVRLQSRDPETLRTVRRLADAGGPHAERLLLLAVRCLDLESAEAWLRELFDSGRLRLAARAAAAIGRVRAIPDLLSLMGLPEQARVAGEAFSMITGIDLAYEDLDGEESEAFHAGPTESPEDDDVAMDPDEDLPWPAVAVVEDTWEARKHTFDPDLRYLCGRPINVPSLHEVLWVGRQRERAAAALELALLEPSRPLFETRAPGRRQKEILRTWRS